MDSDTEYFRRRASEERTAALHTRNTEARLAHIEIAERYEDLVRGIAANEQFLGLRAVDSTQFALGN
jgi:hypothetical protein